MFDNGAKVLFASKNTATSTCFDLAIRSLRAAEIQVHRIWDRPIVSGDQKAVSMAFQDILIDVHFYFISLRNLFRFLKKVVADPSFEHLHPELDQLKLKWFDHYSEGRNAFEHIDSRLLGQRHEASIVEIIVEITEGGAKRKIHYGLNLREGLFLHSDSKWDITQGVFDQIKDDVQALIQRIVDSCESSPPQGTGRFVKQS